MEAYPTIEENERKALCVDTINQGLGLLCDASDFANYDMAKCGEATRMTEGYLALP
jgi:hypothetical protein